MKPPYYIAITLAAVFLQQLAFAGGYNTNSPTNTSTYATIEATFATDNRSVTVSTYKKNNNGNIEQVVLNFEDGSQEKFMFTNKKNVNVSPSITYSALKIIGIWVASNGNNAITSTDSSGYGHYIKNIDPFAGLNLYHDFQTDLGNNVFFSSSPYCNTQKKYEVCHIPPGNPANQHTIFISCNAVQAHLTNHGDAIGECQGGVIPVELISFSAKALNHEIVQLKWTTASEVNNDYIQIEKTSDLNNWERVCKVHGQGTSHELHNYSCTDSNASSTGQNTVYYRPKQVDFNGTYEYFNIIKIRLESTANVNAVESVYPNPATDRIKIKYNASENGPVRIRLMSIEGKAILISSYSAKQGQQVVDLDLPENDLAKGMYVLEVESEGQVYRQKVYKQ